MESRRAAKTRSVGSDPKKPRPPPRPELGERVQSAPSVARRRPSHNARTSEGVKIFRVIDRGSKASLRDDPFFRSYDSPQSVRLAEQSRKGDPAAASSSSLSSDDALPHVNLVVLGDHGVGKSTFIQNSFDMRQPPTSPCARKKMSLDDVIYLVRLIEISVDEIVIVDGKRIRWPKQVGELEIPRVDGVLALYDVTNQESFAEIPELLHALHKSGLPCVLVSCKCDNPPPARQLEPGTIGRFRAAFGSIDTRQTSASKPESQKRCISIILRSILAQSKGSPQQSRTSSRPRAATTSSKESPSKARRSPDALNKHNRARSEIPSSSSASVTTSIIEPSPESSGVDVRRESDAVVSSSRSQSSGSTQGGAQRSQAPSLSSPAVTGEAASQLDVDELPDTQTQGSFSLTSVLRPATADTTDSQVHRTFLNMDEESEDESSEEDTETASADIESLRISNTTNIGADAGCTFADLVDRLLALPTSKQEFKFLPTFLCLYRKFASPRTLLLAIISRFDDLDRGKGQPVPADGRLRSGREFTKAAEQLRYLRVLAQWTSNYPGDFANPTTRAKIISFVNELETSRQFAAAAREISNHLAVVVSDEDATWAYCDDIKPRASNRVLRSHQADAMIYSVFDDSSVDELNIDSADSSIDDLTEQSSRHSATPSNASGTTKTGNTSNQSLAAAASVEEIRREARGLTPVPRTRLTKIQWHLFMETPEEEFAKELTRIDWVMYSAIRPRDFVRHVSLTDSKDADQMGLEDVNRMTNHFNHLSLFVTGMILLRDKPKHRAKALEKFMSIAWKLRQHNNYNSLGSILAGINGTAVHRLAQTKELVPQKVLKEFMRLTILMSTQRSHAAYRLAWENSFAERIPFLPLHRRDLITADSCSRTFVGPDENLINWKKFEIMGEVILGIQKSQERPYPFLQTNDEVKILVLETKILEGKEDSMDPRNELYERSVQLEPSGVGGEASRKKFEWFNRK